MSGCHIGKGWPPSNIVMKILSCTIKIHLGAPSNDRCCMALIPVGHEVKELSSG